MTLLEEKHCYDCAHFIRDEWEEPCKSCRNTLCPVDAKYAVTPLKWEAVASETNETNAVDHPSHYNQGSIECIDAMVSAFGKEATAGFCIINAFKYVWRASNKNGMEDIDKAIWYLTKYKELMGEDLNVK